MPNKFESKKTLKPSTPTPLPLKNKENNTNNLMIDKVNNDFYQTFNADSKCNTIQNLNDKNRNNYSKDS